MTVMKLPGLIDAHVHFRSPGYEHKEDFFTGTQAALAGGVTAVLDMPNTTPPTASPELLRTKAQLAAENVLCDVGLFAGAINSAPVSSLSDAYLPAAEEACGLKIYVSETFGSLRIDDLGLMHGFFRTWAEKAAEVGYRSSAQSDSTQSDSTQTGGIGPIAVHAEEMALPVCLNLSQLYDVPLHIVHVSRRSEIELIARAKERGLPVTCEVTPHHLFLTEDDFARIGPRCDMRPKLASPDDVAAMWEHLAIVDIFATDHAPHTLEEKAQPEPPPGVPGVETMLPLLLTAVHEDRLTIDDIVERCVSAPRRIYGLPEQRETHIEVDVDEKFELSDDDMRTKCGWTPFAAHPVYGNVTGRVKKVVLRGQTVYDDGNLIAERGGGRVLFQSDEPIT